jgi:hypothetical protein
MKRSNLLIAFYLLLIFGSGIVVGGFASRLFWPQPVHGTNTNPPAKLTPEEWRRNYVRELQSKLNLTPDQLTQLNQILDDTGSKVHAEHDRDRQALRNIREEQVVKVRALLTDAQKPEYEKLRQEHERRHQLQQQQHK